MFLWSLVFLYSNNETVIGSSTNCSWDDCSYQPSSKKIDTQDSILDNDLKITNFVDQAKLFDSDVIDKKIEATTDNLKLIELKNLSNQLQVITI